MSATNVMDPGKISAVPTNSFVQKDERTNFVTQADLEEPTDVEPVEAAPPPSDQSEEVPKEGQGDPVVAEVEEKQRVADEIVSAAPADLVDRETLEQSLAQANADIQEAERLYTQGYQGALDELEAGNINSTDFSRLQFKLAMERDSVVKPLVDMKLDYMAELKGAELADRGYNQSTRQGWMSDPHNAALLKDPEVQSILENPSKELRALGIAHSPAAVAAWVENQRLRKEVVALKDASKNSITAAAQNRPPVSGSPGQVSGTPTSTPKVDPKNKQEYNEYLARTYFSAQA